MAFDEQLFLALNFDGGALCDRIMLALSGVAMWLPLYALILWLVWRRAGWRGYTPLPPSDGRRSGAGRHGGRHLQAQRAAGRSAAGSRTPLAADVHPLARGLDIAPDSLRVLRRLSPEALAAAGYSGDWAVHVPAEAVSGRFGTVSAHAATSVALAVLACTTIRRRWFTLLMVLCTAAICYSRIYLAKHFPADILWGMLLGMLLGWAAHRALLHLGRDTARGK